MTLRWTGPLEGSTRRSWWCSLGLHRFHRGPIPGIYVCARPNCREREVGYL